jgi:hypothetical protein
MTIKFDRNSPYWSGMTNADSQFLMIQGTYLVEQFKHRGYIYLNEVYEAFGAVWNPLKNNVCWIKGADEFLITHRRGEPDNWLITVH